MSGLVWMLAQIPGGALTQWQKAIEANDKMEAITHLLIGGMMIVFAVTAVIVRFLTKMGEKKDVIIERKDQIIIQKEKEDNEFKAQFLADLQVLNQNLRDLVRTSESTNGKIEKLIDEFKDKNHYQKMMEILQKQIKNDD